MASMPEKDRAASDRRLLDRFLSLPEVSRAKTILIFFGVGGEIAAGRLLAPLAEMGKAVALPKCLPGNRLEARLVPPGCTLYPGPFSIPEPGDECRTAERESVDLILVPALCYDEERFRLGQGGGYYDRYLAGYGGVTVGLCRDVFLQSRVPREDHDRRVDLVLTETCVKAGTTPPP